MTDVDFLVNLYKVLPIKYQESTALPHNLLISSSDNGHSAIGFAPKLRGTLPLRFWITLFSGFVWYETFRKGKERGRASG
ncbi:MAG: hypothetical protein ABI169_04055 [Chitinophagaceae bacterium]